MGVVGIPSWPIIEPASDINAIAGLSPTLWLKADAGITASAGDPISTWADQSGNGYNFTGTTTTRPVLTRSDNLENWVAHSEDATNAAWDKATYPCSVSGATITATASSAKHGIVQYGGPSVAGSSNAAYFEIGYDNHQYAVVGDAGDSLWHIAVIDLTVGAITRQAYATASITTISPGRFGISLAWTHSSANRSLLVVGFGNASDNSNVPTFTPAGTEKITFYKAALRSSLADSTYLATTTTAQYRGINGLPAVRFDGVDDKMATTATLAQLMTTTAKTVFMVVNPAINDAAYPLLWPSAGGTFQVRTGAANKFQSVNVDSGGADTVTSVATVTPPGAAIIAVTHDGTNLTVSVNGEPPVSGASGASNSDTVTFGLGWNLGATYYNGTISELIVFNTALGASDRARVYNYLARRFGIS